MTIIVAGFVLAFSQVHSAEFTVPNGDFELIFKPSTAITASLSSGGWTQGVGPDCPIESGQYNFSDGTSGSDADIPGWLGYDIDGWIAHGGTYGRDQTTGNLQGSVSNLGNHTPGGANCYLSNSTGWENPAGGLIVSAAPVGTIQANTKYTLSIYAQGDANPVVLNLLADGVIIEPTSAVSPTLSDSWQQFSRTYDAGDLVNYIGQSITIILGIDRDGSGAQTKLDDVSLSYEFIDQAPGNGSEHIASDQILSWTGPSEGNPTYDLYLSSTDPDLGTATQKLFSSSSVNYDPDLNYATKYYWRVDVNVGGEVLTGERWTFTTGGKATDPSIPNGQEIVPGPTVDLSWTGDDFADSYKVYAGTSLPLSFIGEVTDSTYIGLEIPEQLTKYYWRVDEYIGTQLVTAGDVWNFTTSQGQIEAPEGDLNGDWEVSLADLLILAQQWLDGPGCIDHPSDCADLVGDNGVDLADFAVISGNMGDSVDLKINELMAINITNLQDEYGEYEDWIEIYNPKGIPVDIGGMYLTDKLSQPTLWRIPDDSPAETTVAAHGYILIWADGDPEQGPLHVDFSLGNTGEQIGLFSRDGNRLIDSVTFEPQVADVSFGRYPDASSTLRFFDQPTPRTENLSGYLGRVDEPQFSVKRGFYEDAFELTLACQTGGAAIYYTLDSSDPTQASTPYTGPITVSETSCIRAVAFKTDFLPSVSVTNSYIFVADVVAQPEMSTIITDDPVWGPQMEDALLEIPSISLVTPHTIPNYPIESPPEVPVSIEMIFPDGKKGFQENAGVERFGGQYTMWPKQALRVSFKGIYGASRLDYDLFGDTTYGGNDATDSFNQIILRQGSHDSLFSKHYTSKGVYTRNRYCFDRQIEMGHISMRGKFVHMYLNGTYWGLYHLMERPTADFMASYFGGDRKDYDIIKGRGAIKLKEGEWTAWNHLTSNTDNYEIVKEYMDVDNYIDYMLLNFYGGNDHDWFPSHNWVAGRKRVPGGKFKFFMWDNDFLIRRGLNSNTVDNGGPGNMLSSLKQHEEFKIRMGDRAQKHFFNDGMLTPARVKADFTELTSRIERAAIPEYARWTQAGAAVHGATFTPNTLKQSVDWIKNNFADYRIDIVIQQMRDAGIFPSIDAPTFSQHGGPIESSEPLSMTVPEGTIWYTLDGEDPRTLSSSNGSTTKTILIDEQDHKTVLIPTASNPANDNWISNFNFDDNSWISGTGGVGYHTRPGYENYIDIDVKSTMDDINTSCYIRIPFYFDGNPANFNYMTLRMRYDDGFIVYLNGTIVKQVNFTGTPAWNAEADTYRDAPAEFDNFDITEHLGALHTGDNLLAIHGLNDKLSSSDFLMCVKLEAGKVTPADVSPGAFEYTDAITLSESTRLKARALSGTTWSALNETVFAVGPVLENLRITEIMYNPQDPNTEFVELKNVGTETINLTMASFTNGIDFTFPSMELAAGGYILVAQSPAELEAAAPTIPAGVEILGPYTGRLNDGGEKIHLVDAIGRTIHEFDYKDDWYELTDGLGYSLTVVYPADTDPDKWNQKSGWRSSLSQGGTPGYADTALAPDSIVINEVLAHSHGNEPDWIELYNTTEQEINIGGWFLTDDDSDPNKIRKYHIPDNTTIKAGRYKVFIQDESFGDPTPDGTNIPFGLSEGGETVYLYSGLNGEITGHYQTQQKFDASERGVSFGRYEKAELTGGYDFVRQATATPGLPNDAPLIPDIVITEINYNPTLGSSYEFVELYNCTSSPVTLETWVMTETTPGVFTSESVPWRLEGTGYEFPAGVTIDAGSYILIAKDPSKYSLAPCDVYGPYDGKLNNGGEEIALQIPGDMEYGKERFWIPVEKIDYDNTDPWPLNPDGGGDSLNRININTYGRDYSNWNTATPTPGN